MLNNGNCVHRVSKIKLLLKICTPLYPMVYITSALVQLNSSVTKMLKNILTEINLKYIILKMIIKYTYNINFADFYYLKIYFETYFKFYLEI